MGNCAAAYERWKKLRAEKKRAAIDVVLERMNESMNEQITRFKEKEDEYEGKIRGVQLQIDKVKSVIMSGKPTPEQRKLLLKLMGRRKMFQKQRDKYAEMQLQSEGAKIKLEGMRTNAGLLKQHDQLVTDMENLGKLGLDVKGIERKLDSADDVMEDISEFNLAFTQRDTGEPALTDEELAHVEAELEEELVAKPSLALTAPKFKAHTVEVAAAQQPVDPEAELAAMVMAEL